MRFHVVVAILGLALLSGCSTPGVEPASRQPIAPPGSPQESRSHAGPPVYLGVNGPTVVSPSTTVDVRLRIVRNSLSSVPMQLRVGVPAGANLVAGRDTEEIIDASSPTIDRSYRLELSAIPKDDLTFVLTQGDPGFSVRAEGFYRFGRPEPRQPDPPRGPALIHNGSRISTPIVVPPK